MKMSTGPLRLGGMDENIMAMVWAVATWPSISTRSIVPVG